MITQAQLKALAEAVLATAVEYIEWQIGDRYECCHCGGNILCKTDEDGTYPSRAFEAWRQGQDHAHFPHTEACPVHTALALLTDTTLTQLAEAVLVLPSTNGYGVECHHCGAETYNTHQTLIHEATCPVLLAQQVLGEDTHV